MKALWTTANFFTSTYIKIHLKKYFMSFLWLNLSLLILFALIIIFVTLFSFFHFLAFLFPFFFLLYSYRFYSFFAFFIFSFFAYFLFSFFSLVLSHLRQVKWNIQRRVLGTRYLGRALSETIYSHALPRHYFRDFMDSGDTFLEYVERRFLFPNSHPFLVMNWTNAWLSEEPKAWLSDDGSGQEDISLFCRHFAPNSTCALIFQ